MDQNIYTVLHETCYVHINREKYCDGAILCFLYLESVTYSKYVLSGICVQKWIGIVQ
jgi:hypothetical protein